MIELKVAIFIEGLVKAPESFRSHIRRYVYMPCDRYSSVVTLESVLQLGLF